MTLVRPSPVENLYTTLFQLEADRPRYYIYVVRLARSLFISLGFENKVNEMNKVINKYLEKPLMSDFISIVHAYDNPRFMYSKRAYTKVGDSLDYKEITRYELENRLEIVKNWIFDEVTKLSPYIRFTRQTQMMA
jgi:hypothetical protein